MDLSILIVNYETDRLLEECCRSIPSGCTGLEWETLVVDNGSTDGSTAFLERGGDPRFRLLRPGENLGFARGNNRGLAGAAGRFVLLLNPDTWLVPGSVTGMVRHLEARPDLGGVGPRTWLDRDRTLEVCSLKVPHPMLALGAFTLLGRLFPRSRALVRAWEQDRRLAAARTGPVQVAGLGGACLLVRRRLLEDLGGLDEDFYMGYEDTDLSHRLRRAGLGMELLVDREILHYFGHSKRKRGQRDAHLYAWDRGLLLYLRKHYHPLWGALLEGLKGLESLRRQPAGPADREAPAPGPLELSWAPGGSPPYLLEISNTPRFLDSFLAVLEEPELRIPEDLVLRLAPGTYHWRASSLGASSAEPPLGTGCFLRM